MTKKVLQKTVIKVENEIIIISSSTISILQKQIKIVV